MCKMTKKSAISIFRSCGIAVLLLAAAFSLFADGAVSSDLAIERITPEKIKLMPMTKDFRNYFLFQSIENETNIIIGDFVGAEKKIVIIQDAGADNVIDSVFEYYPETGKNIRPSKTTSEIFTELAAMKKDIISGKAFTDNYAYKMRSLPSLVEKLKKGSDIYKYSHGYTVKLYDPDKPSTIMSEFFFGRKDGTYDLIFKTNYYKLYDTVIVPPMQYSVYCERSTDPIVKETVEQLIKMVER